MSDKLRRALGPITRDRLSKWAFARLRPHRNLAASLKPLGRLRLAEHFRVPADLAAVHIPLGGIVGLAEAIGTGLLVAIVAGRPGRETARVAVLQEDSVQNGGVRFAFAPFEHASPSSAYLIACDQVGPDATALTAGQLRAVAKGVASRQPIHMACNDQVPGFSSMRVPLRPAGRMWAVPPGPEPTSTDARVAYALESVWMENRDALVRGWVHGFAREVDSIQVRGPTGPWHAVIDRSPRPDLLAHYPMVPRDAEACGFSAFIPGADCGPLTLKLTLGGEHLQLTADLPKRPISADDAAASSAYQDAWQWFMDQVNQRELAVLEIGSRLVGPMAESWRPKFSHASRFIGFDVHRAPGVDIVGDAHALSDYVGPHAVDAIFSVAVLEHIAMPWVLARELNRALSMGGLTFHVTVQSWPVHEQPNDFWRYTDEALRLLFGALNGFEVVGAGMCQRIRMYPENRTANDPGMGFFPGYGNAWVLARKVSELPGGAEAEARGADLAELSRRYPRHDGTE